MNMQVLDRRVFFQLTVMKSEPSQLSRVDQANKRSIHSGCHTLIQFTLLSNRVFVTIETRPSNVRCRSDIDEIDTSISMSAPIQH